MSLALLQRCTRPYVQQRHRLSDRIRLYRLPLATSGNRRGFLCNAAANGDVVTESAVSDCLERVLGPTAPSQCDFAVVFYEGHEGGQVQKALDAFVRRRPQAPPIFGCSLGEGWKRFQEQYKRSTRYSDDATALQRDGVVQGARGARVVGDQSNALPAPDFEDESDSDTNSEAGDHAVDNDDDDDDDDDVDDDDDDDDEFDVGSKGSSSGEEAVGEGVGFNRNDRNNEQLSDRDDLFSAEAMGQLFGNVETVIEALIDRSSPGGTSRRGGIQAVSRRKARRMRKREEAMRRLYETQGLAPRIVTVLGLGFEGRVQVAPALANYGTFPDLGGGGETVRKVFSLPEEQQAHFLVLSKKSAAFGLERSLERIANLLPGGTRVTSPSRSKRSWRARLWERSGWAACGWRAMRPMSSSCLVPHC